MRLLYYLRNVLIITFVICLFVNITWYVYLTVRTNAASGCDLTLLVTVSECHLCGTLQRQSDIEGIYWIGLCYSPGHVTRNDVIRHVIPCRWYYRQQEAIRHLVADMHFNDTVLLYNSEHGKCFCRHYYLVFHCEESVDRTLLSRQIGRSPTCPIIKYSNHPVVRLPTRSSAF